MKRHLNNKRKKEYHNDRREGRRRRLEMRCRRSENMQKNPLASTFALQILHSQISGKKIREFPSVANRVSTKMNV